MIQVKMNFLTLKDDFQLEPERCGALLSNHFLN